jgi:radical SAM family uncharacterized protein
MSRRLIEKAKRRLKDEIGTTYKDPGGRIKVALVYPNTYHVGMSNLGFQTVYGLFNRRDDILCERAFLPDEEDREEFFRTGTELFTLESQRSLLDYDIIAFSVSFENDYLNILDIMNLSKIPLMREERKDSHSLVILGGLTTFFNPEPLSDFFDLIAIGEAEELIDEMMDLYAREAKEVDKETLLRDMASIEGLYLPGFYEVTYTEDGMIKERITKKGVPERIKRRFLKNIDTFDTYSRILTPHTEFSNMFLIEVSRGCGRGCRFCLADFIYRPPRRRGIKSILKAVELGSVLTNRIGFVGAAVSDYPQIDSLLNIPEIKALQISVSSLRADSITENLIRRLAESGLKTVSIAPEAGSERLRKVINKGINEEDILRASELIFRNGIFNLKLYFMVGLPTEAIEDIEAIIDLTKKVHEIQLKICREKNRIGLLTLSVNCFVPKPFTPFQWYGMEDRMTLKEKINLLKKGLKGIDNVSLIHDIPKWAHFQAFLSRGDRRLGKVLRFIKERGDWIRVYKEAGIDPGFYISRGRNSDEILPWDFIDTGVRKNYLWEEYGMIREGIETPPCMPESCTRCGVC